MEPEGSLPHTQASATRPYPGLAQSSPHTRMHVALLPQTHIFGASETSF